MSRVSWNSVSILSRVSNTQNGCPVRFESFCVARTIWLHGIVVYTSCACASNAHERTERMDTWAIYSGLCLSPNPDAPAAKCTHSPARPRDTSLRARNQDRYIVPARVHADQSCIFRTVRERDPRRQHNSSIKDRARKPTPRASRSKV